MPAQSPLTRYRIDACLLGTHGENDSQLEKRVVEFLREHVYWRRNFHPEDPPAILTEASRHPDYLAFESRMRRELHPLCASLKKSVPFRSPRHIGQMVSDLPLPEHDWSALNLHPCAVTILLDPWPQWLQSNPQPRASSGARLRHTLMNPYLIDHENGISYIELHFDDLQQRIRQQIARSIAH